MVKNPPANAGVVRDTGSIPGLGRSPGTWQPTPVFLPGKSHGQKSHKVAKSQTQPNDSAPMQAEGTQFSQKNIHIPRRKEERGTGWEWLPGALHPHLCPVNQEVRMVGRGRGRRAGRLEHSQWSN